jgi:hypothetical protein
MQSAVYPDRLIRPLPKRSLRSRLSEEAAEAIPFPPNPPSSSFPPYSHGQYGEHGEYVNDSKVLVQQDEEYCDHDHDDDDHHHHHHYHEHDHENHHHHHHHHHSEVEEDVESIEDEDRNPAAVRRTMAYRESPTSQRTTRSSRHAASKASYSGSDGYDAFENTNNKKKRKIPTSGSIALHQSSLSAELAHLALNGSRSDLAVAQDDGAADGQYQASVSHPGNSISGIGRVRHAKDAGRRVSGRNPLGVSTSNSNVRANTSSGSSAKAPPNQEIHRNLAVCGADDIKSTDQGIISAAIANATAALRKPLQKGQENMGILDQQPKASSNNTQFTFTCETDAAKGVTFPEQSLYAAGYAQRAANMSTSTWSSGHHGAAQGPYASSGSQSANGQYPQPAASQAMPHTAAPGKKTRRRKGDVYILAARQRRLQQEYANLHHPPGPEDIWICEFCEYESIFGVPPMALIRQYEIKDRKERKRLAEKRRLLEKAKMKGRKGKKQTKNAAKAANGVNQQNYDQQPLDQLGGDDYLDDGYDDDSIPLPAPPPAPLKQSMPGAYHSPMGRYAAGGGAAKGTGTG